MRIPVTVSVVIAVIVGSSVWGQPFVVAEPPPPPPGVADVTGPPPAGDPELEQLMQELGVPPQEAMMLQLLTRGGMDPLMLFWLMAAQEGANNPGEILPLLLLRSAMQGGKVASRPATILNGDTLYIVHDGVAYKVDLNTLQIVAMSVYKPQPAKPDVLPALVLAPAIAVARDRAQATACLNNMKQVCLAAMMFATDWGNVLPGADWPQTLQPYLGNTQVFRCPAHGDAPLGFAMNERVAGVALGDIPNPAQTILFFESDVGLDMPLGGPEALVAEPRHKGGVVVGYVDGHCQLLDRERVRVLLEK